MEVDFTTVVGIDAAHVKELRWVWPTWKLHRPQILRQPLLLICDAAYSEAQWHRELAFLQHPEMSIFRWELGGVPQREKMLNGLVFGTARRVHTPWYLKLDTDAVALAPGDWIDRNWFEPDEVGRLPVYVSSPWRYTKPPDAIERLDVWGDAIPDLARFPRLNLHPVPGATLLSHRRIISWCFFGLTASAREAAALCGERLPVPSQDTVLWYLAERRKDFRRQVSMKKYGWGHISGRRRLQRTCEEVLSKRASPMPAPFTETDRRSPAEHVAEALASSLGKLIPQACRGGFIGTIGNTTVSALGRVRPLADVFSVPWLAASAPNQLSAKNTMASDCRSVPDGPLDFVILEGEIDSARLRKLIETWWPRVRNGGVLGGINFGHPRDRRGDWGISQAVKAFAASLKIPILLPGNSVWFLRKESESGELTASLEVGTITGVCQ